MDLSKQVKACLILEMENCYHIHVYYSIPGNIAHDFGLHGHFTYPG